MRKLAGIIGFVLAAIFASVALAQPAEPVERRRFSQAQLDAMLAPIALYPDSLLSQILMAATYPRDVFEAASWSRVNGGLRGETAVRAAETEPWDLSVIALTAFPQVLELLDERREWTQDLGDAFIVQPEQVMDTVQELRRRADEAGNLRTTEEIIVQRQGKDYIIESPVPEEVYVPYYDPRVVYGDWWWPSYEPVYWRPWPGYAYRSRYWGWGPSIVIGSGFWFGHLDWRHRHIRYHHRPWYWRGHDFRHGHRWTHNHRWRDRDHHHAGRDGRHRDPHGDRDGRWRDRDGDGRPDRRWRDRDGDGRPDRRWRDRDGDGQPDRRGRDRDRDGDGHADRGGMSRDGGRTAGPAPSGGSRQVTGEPAQHGFFRPPANEAAARAGTERGNAVRPAPPTFHRPEVSGDERRQARERYEARERAVRERPQPASGMGRPAEPRYMAPPRTVHVPSGHSAQPRASVPAPQPRLSAPPPSNPVTRAPVERSAPAPAPVARPAPERSAPAERSDGNSNPSSRGSSPPRMHRER